MVGYLTCQGVMMGLVFSIPPALSAGSISVGGVSIAFIRALCAGGVVILFTWGVARRFVPVLLTFLSNNQANSKELYLLGVVSLAMVMVSTQIYVFKLQVSILRRCSRNSSDFLWIWEPSLPVSC